MPPTATAALAGAGYQPPASTTRKTVLLAGAAGKLGERILARLLGMPEYQRIYVLSVSEMPSTEPKLFPMTAAQWTGQIDDVIAVVDDSGSADQAHAGIKHTDIFSSLVPDAILPLAQHAKASGASRFMLVTPIGILLQPAALHAQLASPMEVQLHQVGFDSLLIVRPSDHETRQRHTGLAQRFWGMLINTATGLLAGARHAPMSVDGTARAIALALQDSTPGLRILETDHLQRLLQPAL